MASGDSRAAWGRRRVTYFVHDPSSNLFAPSKFAAYTRIPKAMVFGESIPFNPAMTVKAYAAIPHDTPAFDGRKAWQKISSLGFKVAKAADCPAPIQAHFRAWLALHRTTVLTDFNEAEILFTPAA